MKAVILCAGIGSRIRDITHDEIPKCLLDISGISILERQIQSMRESGVNEIIIVTGFKAEKIHEKLRGNDGICFIHNSEFATTNILASFQLALQKIDTEEDIFVLAGDVVFEPAILQTIITKMDFDIVAAVDLRKADRESVKVMIEDDRISRFGKDIGLDKANGEFLGLMHVKECAIKKMRLMVNDMINDKKYKKSAYLFDMLNSLIENYNSKVGFVDIMGLIWEEIDCEQDLVRANLLFQEKLNAES